MALKYQGDVRMKGIVVSLRKDWYGNGDVDITRRMLREEPINRCGLWRTCLKHTSTTYVGLCEGLSGKIGLRIEDDTY